MEHAPQKITPETFFEQLVPEAMAAQTPLRKALKGALHVRLVGLPLRSWTIDFDRGTVVPGAANSTAQLTLGYRDFEALLENTLDMDETLRAGRVAFRGDLRMLGGFAGMIAPRRTQY